MKKKTLFELSRWVPRCFRYPEFKDRLDEPLTRGDFNLYARPDSEMHYFIGVLLFVVGVLIGIEAVLIFFL